MAEAQKRTRLVEESRVDITLDMDEVRTLYTVLSRVGGSHERTPRKHVAAISRAIEVAMGASDYTDKDWANPEYEMFSGSLCAKGYAE